MNVAASDGAATPSPWELAIASKDLMATVVAARPAMEQAAERAAAVVSRNAVVDGHVDTYA